MESRYDKMYSENSSPFGERPQDEVLKLEKLVPAGADILELGAGYGRNTLYLASIGHNLTAVDLSQVGLDQLEEQAKTRGFSIATVHADLRQFSFDHEWDAIISTYMLHHLSPKDAKDLIQKVKDYTKAGGVNIWVCFGDQSEMAPTEPKTHFFPSLTDLQTLYPDWKIIETKEENVRTHAVNKSSGERFKNTSVSFISQKP